MCHRLDNVTTDELITLFERISKKLMKTIIKSSCCFQLHPRRHTHLSTNTGHRSQPLLFDFSRGNPRRHDAGRCRHSRTELNRWETTSTRTYSHWSEATTHKSVVCSALLRKRSPPLTVVALWAVIESCGAVCRDPAVCCRSNAINHARLRSNSRPSVCLSILFSFRSWKMLTGIYPLSAQESCLSWDEYLWPEQQMIPVIILYGRSFWRLLYPANSLQ